MARPLQAFLFVFVSACITILAESAPSPTLQPRPGVFVMPMTKRTRKVPRARNGTVTAQALSSKDVQFFARHPGDYNSFFAGRCRRLKLHAIAGLCWIACWALTRRDSWVRRKASS